jgi:hypothetical protein
MLKLLVQKVHDNLNNPSVLTEDNLDDIWFQWVLQLFIVCIYNWVEVLKHVAFIIPIIIHVIKIKIYQSNSLFERVLPFYWQTLHLVLTINIDVVTKKKY